MKAIEKMARHVTLVNRTSKTLMGVWNGRQHMIEPGSHSFPEAQALKFRDQNPIMGTEDPFTLQKQYLMGIPEMQDDCSPIEQSNSVELQDRSKLGASQQNVQVIQGHGLYAPRADASKPLPIDGASNFSKP